MYYLVKSPTWLKKIYPECIWQMDEVEKNIYLTFDDGPHPTITKFVLEELKKYNAKATFFCIGKNVIDFPETYNQIIIDEHAVGNHSFNHLNGWETDNKTYLQDIKKCKEVIPSKLFRPPYGRATKKQLAQIINEEQLTPVMWSVLSGDFDRNITNETCLQNVLKNTFEGSIIVFHDSEKAFERMQYALPRVLEYYSDKGYKFYTINNP